ncbi:MAG TPA: hypothetical protein VHT49_00220 [Acidimicrobiales bacterium]|nr:hypothetical protein [Acidimicrobiales bacterium]
MSPTYPSPSPSYGLAPRPEVDPAVLAVLAASAESVWAEVRVAAPEEEYDGGPAWRFSGRWWARPVASRRDRPWASR